MLHDYLHTYGIGAARVCINICMRYLTPSSRGTCTSANVTCALRRGAAACFWQEPDTVWAAVSVREAGITPART